MSATRRSKSNLRLRSTATSALRTRSAEWPFRSFHPSALACTRCRSAICRLSCCSRMLASWAAICSAVVGRPVSCGGSIMASGERGSMPSILRAYRQSGHANKMGRRGMESVERAASRYSPPTVAAHLAPPPGSAMPWRALARPRRSSPGAMEGHCRRTSIVLRAAPAAPGQPRPSALARPQIEVHPRGLRRRGAPMSTTASLAQPDIQPRVPSTGRYLLFARRQGRSGCASRRGRPRRHHRCDALFRVSTPVERAGHFCPPVRSGHVDLRARCP